MGASAQTGEETSFSRLISLASAGDRIYLYIGVFAAVVTGCGLPSFAFIFGNVVDAFGSNPIERLDTIKNLTLIMTYVSTAIWVAAYFYTAFLLIFSEKVTLKIKVAYLSSILKQEAAWFDMTSYEELSARLGKESLSIQKAIGEKFGQIWFCFALIFAGLTFATIKGWSFSLTVVAIMPFLAVMVVVLVKFAEKSEKEAIASYGQSAGYAEQALNSIRVVTAYGRQQFEIDNYVKYLDRARQTSNKAQLGMAMVLGCIIFCIYSAFAYSFWIGGIFVRKQVMNTVLGEPYTAGDVIACFFGVVFGIFSLGQITPNVKAVAEGKAAGKSAFDIIERQPAIPVDDPLAEKKQVDGSIEFKNVSFYYPSRPDMKVLDNFSATFEMGKTTAIVGPSGSGKSTIV